MACWSEDYTTTQREGGPSTRKRVLPRRNKKGFKKRNRPTKKNSYGEKKGGEAKGPCNCAPTFNCFGGKRGQKKNKNLQKGKNRPAGLSRNT